MAESAPVIEATGLEKTFGDRTVLDLDYLSVAPGELMAVLGPSGSGKSVLLRVLNLLERPDAGTVRFHGEEVQGLAGRERMAVQRRMAMVFQDPLLFRGTVFENVTYGLRIRRVSARERSLRAGEILEAVGLSDLAGKRVTTLSGGEAQRVAVARALVIEPEVLLFDEPFANLDVPTRQRLQMETKAILGGRDITAVFVTHDQDEAARMGDRILVLHRGRAEQAGTAREIFYDPSTEFVARFVGMENVYDGVVTTVDDGLASVSVGRCTFEVMTRAVPGSRVKLGLRPEEVTLVSPGDLDAVESGRNAFAGTVVGVEKRGPLAHVELECPFPLKALVTRRSLEEMGVEPGARMGARFKATAVAVIGVQGGETGR